jgi:hypoxanthine phosphoribosyltransferase
MAGTGFFPLNAPTYVRIGRFRRQHSLQLGLWAEATQTTQLAIRCENVQARLCRSSIQIIESNGSEMRTLLSEAELNAGVQKLASEIDSHYGSRPLTVIAIMTGSLVLFADLIRRLSMPQRVGVVQASSYRGGTTPGELQVDDAMMIEVKGRDVLLVDDIFDTGKTLDRVSGMMLEHGATSVQTAVLLHKLTQHSVEIRPDFVAFEIPDEFVVGYGLDYLDMYRNLPYLAVLSAAEIEATAAESET